MNVRDHIVAQPATSENFARYGAVYDLQGSADPRVVWTRGQGWTDGFTRTPLIDGSGHLGMTSGGSAPWDCTEMERHHKTEEAIFCAAEPVVLAVAPASDADAPKRADIEAFVISPGQVVVMKRGVWHDACRGAAGPAAYFWMAMCGLEPNAWVPLEDGPLTISIGRNGGQPG